MTFSIEEASRIIDIKLPTTANALKSAFRRRSRQVHPDHSIAVDAKTQFQALAAAYEFVQLQRDWILCDDGSANSPAQCVDGTLLSDLGQGLGATVNGRPCEPCSGKGFQSYHDDLFAYTPCKDCRTRWLTVFRAVIEYRCRRCGGDGNFKRHGKAIGPCKGCSGNGWIKAKTSSNHCVTCKGAGKIKNEGMLLHNKCSNCKGTGELLVFNPVIPKGLLR